MVTSKGSLILRSKESMVLGTQTKDERNLALVPGNQQNENSMVWHKFVKPESETGQPNPRMTSHVAK